MSWRSQAIELHHFVLNRLIVFLGTEIPVYPNGNDQNHLNNIPLFIVRIQELPHPLFQRDRQNLIYTATVDLSFVSTHLRFIIIVGKSQ
jgi:hypothetical protein